MRRDIYSFIGFSFLSRCVYVSISFNFTQVVSWRRKIRKLTYLINDLFIYLLAYLLTAWSITSIHLENLTGLSQSKNSLYLMKHEVSLPLAQVPSICPYTEPSRSSLCPHIQILKIGLNITIPSTFWSSKLPLCLRSPHQNLVYMSPSPYLLHVRPI